MNNRDLKYACFWIGMVRILNGIENLEAKPIDIWKKAPIWPKTVWNPAKKSWIGMDGFQMVGTMAKVQPFKNRTIWNRIFKKVQILNVSKVIFKIPNALPMGQHNAQLFYKQIWQHEEQPKFCHLLKKFKSC